MFQLQNIKQNPEFMSKEQTPITAEELKRKMKYAMFQKCWEDSSLSPIMKESLKGAIDVAEQHAQSKVLEVLNDLQFNIKGLAHDEIYWLIETQVKPNYKL